MKLKFKRHFFLILVSLFFSIAASAEIENYEMHKAIYDETYQHCKTKSWLSAFQLGFNAENLASSTAGWIKFSHNNNVRKLRTSPGFQQALYDCYNLMSVEGNLKKQLISMGHLTTEVSAFLVSIAGLYGGGKLLMQASSKFPVFTSTLLASQLSMFLADSCKAISTHLTQKPLTTTEKEELQSIKKNLFAESDKIIAQVKLMTEQRIRDLVLKIKNSKSVDEQDQLTIQLKIIQTRLSKLNTIEVEKNNFYRKYNPCHPDFLKNLG